MLLSQNETKGLLKAAYDICGEYELLFNGGGGNTTKFTQVWNTPTTLESTCLGFTTIVWTSVSYEPRDTMSYSRFQAYLPLYLSVKKLQRTNQLQSPSKSWQKFSRISDMYHLRKRKKESNHPGTTKDKFVRKTSRLKESSLMRKTVQSVYLTNSSFHLIENPHFSHQDSPPADEMLSGNCWIKCTTEKWSNVYQP